MTSFLLYCTAVCSKGGTEILCLRTSQSINSIVQLNSMQPKNKKPLMIETKKFRKLQLNLRQTPGTELEIIHRVNYTCMVL